MAALQSQLPVIDASFELITIAQHNGTLDRGTGSLLPLTRDMSAPACDTEKSAYHAAFRQYVAFLPNVASVILSVSLLQTLAITIYRV
ncbi:MAG: hypothetical protein M1820_009303 [Bogoriella megaspora]|nr:MAG: hypothetical protein M1820_009303 [Bogoriella megaspora]